MLLVTTSKKAFGISDSDFNRCVEIRNNVFENGNGYAFDKLLETVKQMNEYLASNGFDFFERIAVGIAVHEKFKGFSE